MDISALTNVTSEYIKQAVEQDESVKKSGNSFDSVFQSALQMLDETNRLQNNAEAAEIQFALGKANNTHDLQIAQEKANIALQYTVAVRDRLLDAYKEIMNMQI